MHLTWRGYYSPPPLPLSSPFPPTAMFPPQTWLFSPRSFHVSGRRCDFRSGLAFLPFPDFPISHFPILSLPCDGVFICSILFPPRTLKRTYRHQPSVQHLPVHTPLCLGTPRAQLYIFPLRFLCATTKNRFVSPAPNQSPWEPFRLPPPRLLRTIVFIRDWAFENVAGFRARSATRKLARKEDCHRVLPE